MQGKTAGIVLHTLRYGDNSLIVHVYTEQYGSVSFSVRQPRSRKSSMKQVLFQPLSLLELDFDYRENQQLQHIQEVHALMPYASIPYHPVKATIALFLAEFLYYALREEQTNPELFQYIQHSLMWLDARESQYANFPATFLLRLTRFLGFWPDIEEAQAILRRDEIQLVPCILRMDFPTMHLFHFTTHQRTRLMAILNNYYRIHVPGFPEMKSVSVLHEVLS